MQGQRRKCGWPFWASMLTVDEAAGPCNVESHLRLNLSVQPWAMGRIKVSVILAEECMRLTTPAILILSILIAACGGSIEMPRMPNLGRAVTPEEKARQEEQNMQEREAAEAKHKKAAAVLQAFSLQDVRGCNRVGRINFASLDDARWQAAAMDGNRVLAQHKRRPSFLAGSKVLDEWEVFQCPAP